jgi:formylmethanofuran-tetrahydromethanopterin formyltransferase (EC 2.3.1.101)
MKATRVLITAHNETWARNAAVSMTGFATSVIACGCEAGIERMLGAEETPDGRPGVSVLLFSMSGKELAKQLERRVGQCVLTCPTTAIYAGLDEGEAIALGRNLRFFGDGWQISKMIDGKRYWRVPVMDGEFVAQETTALVKAVGGGNLLLLARDTDAALAGAEAAVEAMRAVRGTIMPSRVGWCVPAPRWAASTRADGLDQRRLLPGADAAWPEASELDAGTRCVMEIVIDGLTEADVAASMRAGIAAIVARGGAAGVTRISAGNYGGKLGPFHFHLHKLIGEGAA